MVKEDKDDEKKKRKQKASKPKEAKAEQKPAAPAEAPEKKSPEAAAAPAPEKEKPESPRRRKKSAPKKAQAKVMIARGKRKESIARATIREGNGTIRINSRNLSSLSNPYVREIIREPMRYVGPEANGVDISVNVSGGGAMGQAQAARTAIANALAMYFDQLNLKDKFIEIDRSLIVEDTRRVEPKKFRGPKARARFQKSYR